MVRLLYLSRLEINCINLKRSHETYMFGNTIICIG